jgi:hypothetical protein
MVTIDVDRRVGTADGAHAALLAHHLRNLIGAHSVSALPQEIGATSIESLGNLLRPLVVTRLAVGGSTILG